MNQTYLIFAGRIADITGIFMKNTGDKEILKQLKETFNYTLNYYQCGDKQYTSKEWEEIKRANWVKWEIRK